MHSRNTQYLIFQIGISKYLYKALLTNLVTYVHCKMVQGDVEM